MNEPISLLARIQQRLAFIETTEPNNQLAVVIEMLLHVVEEQRRQISHLSQRIDQLEGLAQWLQGE
jgi:hypothetical protein